MLWYQGPKAVLILLLKVTFRYQKKEVLLLGTQHSKTVEKALDSSQMKLIKIFPCPKSQILLFQVVVQLSLWMSKSPKDR